MVSFVVGIFVGAAAAILILGWCLVVEEEDEAERARHRRSYPTDVEGWTNTDEEESE